MQVQRPFLIERPRPLQRLRPTAATSWALPRALGLLALFVSGALGSCAPSPSELSAEAHLGLRRGLLRGGRVQLEVSTPELTGFAQEAAARLSIAAVSDDGAGVPASWTRLEVAAPVPAGSADDGARVPRGVIAEVKSALAAPLLEALGVELLDGGGFVFAGHEYTSPSDALRGVLPDPERPGLPVGFLLINDAAPFAESDELLVLGWRPFLEILRSAEIERRFEVRGRAPHDLVLEFDRSELFERPRTKYAEYQDEGVNFLYRKDPRLLGLLPLLPQLVDSMLEVRDSVREFATAAGAAGGALLELPRTVVHGFASEAFLDGKSGLLARRDAATARVIVLLSNDSVPPEAFEVTARVLLEEALGRCRTPWLGRGLELELGLAPELLDRRLAEIVRATLALSAAEIVEGTGAWSSPLVRGPEQALLTRVLIEERGAEFVARLWRGEEEFEPDLALEERLHAAHLELVAPGTDVSDAPGSDGGGEAQDAPLRGFGMWLGGLDDPLRREERVQLLEGQPFDELVELGANAVLLSYPVTLGARSESFLVDERSSAPRSSPSLQELSLILAQARSCGLAVVLWPRLILAEQTSLTARSKWTSAEELQQLFRDLREHLVHAALLARSGDADWLILGGSLGRTSSTAAPQVDGQEGFFEATRGLRIEEWSETVARVRAAAGPVRLMLAPSSWEEAGEADFVGELDAYGLSVFPMWTDAGEPELRPRPDDVMRGFANVLGVAAERAAEQDLPLMLLEVGHARTAGASRLSMRRAGPTDPNAQGLFLEGVAAALERRRGPVPDGLFLWRVAAPAAPADPRGFLIDLDAEPELLGRILRSGR